MEKPAQGRVDRPYSQSRYFGACRHVVSRSAPWSVRDGAGARAPARAKISLAAGRAREARAQARDEQHVERPGRRRELVDPGKLGHGADDGQRHHLPGRGRAASKHRRPRAALVRHDDDRGHWVLDLSEQQQYGRVHLDRFVGDIDVERVRRAHRVAGLDDGHRRPVGVDAGAGRSDLGLFGAHHRRQRYGQSDSEQCLFGCDHGQRGHAARQRRCKHERRDGRSGRDPGRHRHGGNDRPDRWNARTRQPCARGLD